MRLIPPAVTVLLTAHMKPYLADALTSVASQTSSDYECIVIDSGAWIGKDDERSVAMADIYRGWHTHPLIEWAFTGEQPGQLTCPVSVATNLAIRAGLVRGRYVCHFYDDDEYYPQFIEKMAGYLDGRPEAGAVWCTQDRVNLHRDGSRAVAGQIQAYTTLTQGMIDNRVDGGQVMYRREVLDALGDPWMPEESGTCRHSDGVFLERVAGVTPIEPLGETLLAHRFTPLSTYSPT